MATIDDINMSISDMSEEEAFKLIMAVRKRRRIFKGNNKKKQQARKKLIDVNKMLTGMSDDMKRMLIEKLEGN